MCLHPIKFLWNEGWNPRNCLIGWSSFNFMGFKKKKHPQAWKNREMRTSCTPAQPHTHTRSQTQIWTHVKKSAAAGSWACLMCGNQRGPLAHELIFVLVWSFDINAVSSRSFLIFKCCTSWSCSYACTTNSRMLISSEQTLKMQHNNQRFLPPAGEGGKEQCCMEEWPTLQESGRASW